MPKTSGLTDISQCRTIDALQNALDEAYRRLVETAKADWNRLFAGQDPGDDSVTVRVSKDQIPEELAGLPRTGFVPVYRKPINRRSSQRRR